MHYFIWNEQVVRSNLFPLYPATIPSGRYLDSRDLKILYSGDERLSGTLPYLFNLCRKYKF